MVGNLLIVSGVRSTMIVLAHPVCAVLCSGSPMHGHLLSSDSPTTRTNPAHADQRWLKLLSINLIRSTRTN
ncbi:hypothetical protein GGR54DRAFT_626539 [Hypoxylon sp. NC1633]|nr:hypothetical protein GGR54DRAFT_626539 [Hypoxylon sp. NC1633]